MLTSTSPMRSNLIAEDIRLACETTSDSRVYIVAFSAQGEVYQLIEHSEYDCLMDTKCGLARQGPAATSTLDAFLVPSIREPQLFQTTPPRISSLYTMSEATRPKYDNLPGIDTAPDIYETPDLAEDVSTIQASTAVSESDGDDNNDEPDISVVRNRRLQPGQARHRFQPARIDARGVDFSDNITAQRQSYRTSTRRQRRRGEILGEDSDEEEESFAKKLLRIKRELAGLEEEYERRVESGDKSKIEEQDPKEMLEKISGKVDTIYTAHKGGARGAQAILDRTVQKFDNYEPFKPSPKISKAITNLPPLPGTQIQRNQLEFVLNQAAEFDKRITQMENNLGLNGNTMPDLSDITPFPVATTLTRLEQTLGLIGDASTNNLDAVTQNVKKLTAEAEHLKAVRDEAAQAGSASDDDAATYPDQEAKINALYGTLPSIDKLAPILPLVLERLRTLRLVHTSAWQADEVLTELERRQSKQENEIKRWERQLEIVEKDMKKAEKSMVNNIKVVGDDVKMLEEKMAKLLEARQEGQEEQEEEEEEDDDDDDEEED
jgi:nuclear migration protein JNM1